MTTNIDTKFVNFIVKDRRHKWVCPPSQRNRNPMHLRCRACGKRQWVVNEVVGNPGLAQRCLGSIDDVKMYRWPKK